MGTPSRRERARTGRRIVVLLACLSAIGSMTSAFAQGELDGPTVQTAASVPDLDLDEVTVGQRGHAVTAGPGNRLERFPVEVVAVLWDAGPGFPLVLVRAGGPFIEASGGIAAGMSGSPVYLDTARGHHLLGAIGYVFPNADHDLALVTPIAAMRSAAGDASSQAPEAAPVPASAVRADTGGTRSSAARLPRAQDLPYVAGLGSAEPVATPILMSGASQRTLTMLRPLFDGATVSPFPAQGGAMPPGVEPAYRVEPGAALAVSLVRGDVSLAAVGTITTVEDGRLLAFGHPFLGYGAVTMPFAPAYVSTIVASSEVPFKLANVGSRLLGVVTEDRPGALAGTLDVAPDLLAVTLNVTGVGGSATYRFEVTPDERLYPVLVAVATLELLDRHVQRTGAGFAELAWEIAFEDGTRANVLEQVSHHDDITWAAAVLAAGPLDVLATNVFRRAEVASVAINVRLEDRPSVATIEDVVPESTEVDEGGTLEFHVRLQPYRESAAVRTITVKLPPGHTGELRLAFRGGRVPREENEADEDERDTDEPRSFGELLDALRQRLQATELVVELLDDEGGVERLQRVPFPYVVEGSEAVTVTVRRRDPAGDGLDLAPDPDPGAAPSEGSSDGID